jgi:hypothetical protein
MKPQLDYSITLPHHDDAEAKMEVSITNYQDDPVMTVEVDKKRISLTRAEIELLHQIFILYDRAQAAMITVDDTEKVP